jgi:hypothetical protein
MLPPVRGKRRPGNQSLVVEILNDPAEVARIKAKLDPDLLGGRIFAGGDLVQHPRFAQRERTFQELLIEHAELAGVEAVKGPHRGYLAVRIWLGHGASKIIAIVKYLFDFGKYMQAHLRPP